MVTLVDEHNWPLIISTPHPVRIALFVNFGDNVHSVLQLKYSPKEDDHEFVTHWKNRQVPAELRENVCIWQVLKNMMHYYMPIGIGMLSNIVRLPEDTIKQQYDKLLTQHPRYINNFDALKRLRQAQQNQKHLMFLGLPAHMIKYLDTNEDFQSMSKESQIAWAKKWAKEYTEEQENNCKGHQVDRQECVGQNKEERTDGEERTDVKRHRAT